MFFSLNNAYRSEVYILQPDCAQLYLYILCESSKTVIKLLVGIGTGGVEDFAACILIIGTPFFMSVSVHK